MEGDLLDPQALRGVLAGGCDGVLHFAAMTLVAESVAQMGLRYSTVTGVARDDQPDGAAWPRE